MCPSTELKNSNCQSGIDTKTSLIAVQRLACVLGPDKTVHPPNHIYTRNLRSLRSTVKAAYKEGHQEAEQTQRMRLNID
ncbi:hypothetical protein CHARACLAT_007060 [Characodon lateralis]|uniref:Uncharacterized protein n=1 Tax=Characodon lateralis TaxID=208331 RepID=A0ABU7ERK6_9TELE|nr:hypothetical protein [Characodon lateralis]